MEELLERVDIEELSVDENAPTLPMELPEESA